jgi:hypothetical protein
MAWQNIPQKWNAKSNMSILCKNRDTLMKMTVSLMGWAWQDSFRQPSFAQSLSNRD